MAGTVRDVMTGDPLRVSAQTTLEDAAVLMASNDVGDVLVTNDGGIQGILTDRDLVVRGVAAGRHPGATAVGECCSTDVVTVNADDTPDQAATLMRRHALRRLPVVDGDQLVGIVSLGDLAVAEDRDSALADISAAPPNT